MCSRMSKIKVLSLPHISFSYISRNHESGDRVKCPLVVDFSDFTGQLNIEEF